MGLTSSGPVSLGQYLSPKRWALLWSNLTHMVDFLLHNYSKSYRQQAFNILPFLFWVNFKYVVQPKHCFFYTTSGSGKFELTPSWSKICGLKPMLASSWTLLRHLKKLCKFLIIYYYKNIFFSPIFTHSLSSMLFLYFLLSHTYFAFFSL